MPSWRLSSNAQLEVEQAEQCPAARLTTCHSHFFTVHCKGCSVEWAEDVIKMFAALNQKFEILFLETSVIIALIVSNLVFQGVRGLIGNF